MLVGVGVGPIRTRGHTRPSDRWWDVPCREAIVGRYAVCRQYIGSCKYGCLSGVVDVAIATHCVVGTHTYIYGKVEEMSAVIPSNLKSCSLS